MMYDTLRVKRLQTCFREVHESRKLHSPPCLPEIQQTPVCCSIYHSKLRETPVTMRAPTKIE